MRKILLVAEYGSLNGGERSFLSVLPIIQSGGWRFAALVPAPSEFADALSDAGVDVVPFSYHEPDGDRKPLDQIREEIRLHLEKIQPNLVQANSLSTSRMMGPLADRLDASCIGYLRDIVKLSRQAISDLNRMPKLVAVSQATMDWHVQQGVSKNRIQVVYNGVDLDSFRPRSATGNLHRELNLDSTVRLLLSVGQIGIRKGLDVTLAALEPLFSQDADLHFVVVGSRHSQKQEAQEFEAALYERSGKHPLKGRVHWLGRRSDVAAIMNECTMHVHSARQEPLGRVLLECFASGLPAIATDVGGTREIYRDAPLESLLVPPDDIDALSKRIDKWLSDNSRLKSAGLALRGIAETHFSNADCARNLRRIYENL